MTSFKEFACLAFSVLMAQVALSQSSTIEGSAKHWAGKEVSLSVCTDYITNTYAAANQTTINEDGSFTLKLETTETTAAWVLVNRWRAPIYLEPGKTYQISLVQTDESVLVDTWQNGFFDYDFIDLKPDDLNAKLSKFDGEFFNFYLDNAQFIGTSRMKTLVNDFALQHEDSTWRGAESEYKNYAIAEMKLSTGMKRDVLFETYLSDTSRYYSSEAWYRFFEIFFTDYFQNFDSKHNGMSISNRLRKEISADSLDVLLMSDDFLQNDYTRQLVTLNAIAEVGASNLYNRKQLSEIVAWIGNHAINNQVKRTSDFLIKKLADNQNQEHFEKLTENWIPKVTTEDDGKYTLVMIGDSQNKESQKEAMVLNGLLEKYGETFKVVELDVNSKSGVKPEMTDTYSVKSVGAFLDRYRIYGIPHFMWFDAQGKILESDLEKPSMGLEKRLYKIKTDKRESQRIKVGSK